MEVERVLIVEDSKPLLRSLSRTLGERFREVRGCRTRAEAVRLIDSFAPQLVLLDVVLPDGDAFDVLRDIASSGAAPTVVAMSGSTSREQVLALYSLGVRAYLPKPLTSAALARALVEALSSEPGGTGAGADGARAEPPPGRFRRLLARLRRRG